VDHKSPHADYRWVFRPDYPNHFNANKNNYAGPGELISVETGRLAKCNALIEPYTTRAFTFERTNDAAAGMQQ